MTERTDQRSQARDKSSELGDLWQLLHAVDKKLDMHIAAVAESQPKLDRIINLVEQSKGVIVFLKWLATIGGSIVAVLMWAKDHIK